MLIQDEAGSETTMSVLPGQEEDSLSGLRVEGMAIIVRSGGGRAGEAFVLERDRLTIGRSPDSDIFLDDVTVSRRHAVLVRRGRSFAIEDLGSLNGTFVNRKRVDGKTLEDGDEMQIGKYKLTFLER
jgi:pSer/pThr/pTyr-binding forkhead associated (FHA) protein